MSYAAYRPGQSSRSEALRPTLPTPFGNQHAAYEPMDEHNEPSPIDQTPLNPFGEHQAYSSDSVNTGRPYYGAGGGGRPEEMNRQYSDDIPLRQQATPMSSEVGDARGRMREPVNKSGMYAGETSMTADEIARQERFQARQQAQERSQQKGRWSNISWVCWTMTIIQLSVFIAELVRASMLTGSPIETSPQFNPMIGPSIEVFINMGARYIPCMKDAGYLNVTAQTLWPCPNSTTSDASSPMNHCSLGELCGLNAQPGDYPVFQWFRFITPMFLHAGIIHIGFNLLLQMTLGREIEHLIGSIRFLLVYLSSGIFGFILGGNFAAPGIASMGASGALFGITAISLLDLLYTWGNRKNPVTELILIVVEIIVSLVLGLLPGLDNFSHIGGLLMGLVLGICLLRSPDPLRRRLDVKPPKYGGGAAFEPSSPVEDATGPFTDARGRPRAQVASYKEFTAHGPVGFFRGRKPLWWAWWLVRAGALVAVVVTFIVLLNNFYIYNTQCGWCKYLSCLPVNNWCDLGRVLTSNTTTSPAGKRELLASANLFGYH